MSLQNFDDLTDVELHRKLLEYEFPNVPITETSRGFLVKKLKNHVKNLKSRKLSTNPFVTQRAKHGIGNLVTKANNWSQHNTENSPQVSAIGTPVDVEESVDKLNHGVAELLRERSRRHRTQQTNQQMSTLADNSPNGYLSMTWKILGIQENCKNCVWWCFTLFFLVVTFMYMVKVTDLTTYINEDNTHCVICGRFEPAGPLLRPPFACIDRKRLQPALAIVRNLIEKLKIRAERHYCYDPKKTRAMSVAEFIRSTFEEGNTVDIRNIREAQYLITCNPQWKIDMVDSKENPITFNGVDKSTPYRDTFFVLKRPRLPISCSLFNKAYRFMHFVSNVALIISVIMLGALLYCYVRRIQEQHLLAVQSYQHNILEELRQRAVNSENLAGREVVVNHLRDQWIPATKRKQELRFWNEALKELEKHESRVRFDMTIRDGEEFRTMRWADNTEQLLPEDSTTKGSDKSLEVETNC